MRVAAYDIPYIYAREHITGKGLLQSVPGLIYAAVILSVGKLYQVGAWIAR